MNKKTILSFCIPTYNNVSSLFRLVIQILTYKSDLIEVVILDNGSSDGTLQKLNTISDYRLKVFTNDVNKGALYNMVNVLHKGKSEFLLYITDHDHVIIDNIGNFIKFLDDNSDVACGYCEYNLKNISNSFLIYPAGVQSITKIAYITRHPTGYFFKMNLLHSISFLERFSDYKYVDLFPLEFAFAELCSLGKGAIYNENLVYPETGERVVEHKSATTDGKLTTAFFSPQTRLKLAINFENHIQSLKISNKSKKKLIIDSFFRELFLATFGYRFVMQNQKLCIHYRMETRTINYIKLFQMGHEFYKNYSKFVIEKRFIKINDKFSYKVFMLNSLIIKVLKKINFFKIRLSIYSYI
jgi:glycosyltransferase involved in cell wall biosynthesis